MLWILTHIGGYVSRSMLSCMGHDTYHINYELWMWTDICRCARSFSLLEQLLVTVKRVHVSQQAMSIALPQIDVCNQASIVVACYGGLYCTVIARACSWFLTADTDRVEYALVSWLELYNLCFSRYIAIVGLLWVNIAILSRYRGRRPVVRIHDSFNNLTITWVTE